MNIFYSVVLFIFFLLGCLYLYGESQDKKKAIEKLNRVKERLDYNFVQEIRHNRDASIKGEYMETVLKVISIVKREEDATIGVQFDTLDRSGFVEIIMTFKDVKAAYYFIPPFSNELRSEITRSRKSLMRNEIDLMLRIAQEDLTLAVSNGQIDKGHHLTRDDLRPILIDLTNKHKHVIFVDFKISYDAVMIRIHLKSDYSKTVEQIIPIRN
ncbi:hypothetical protein YUBABA_01860 [Serratia phage vB_SmaM-Yubaba]|nr:hypothetical protein YUBABA_01860 [Serratia phage vB_SmaM-Yubaba]